jgi:pilus assembly protein Flp/PilA
LILLNKNAFGA